MNTHFYLAAMNNLMTVVSTVLLSAMYIATCVAILSCVANSYILEDKHYCQYFKTKNSF